MAEYEVTYNEDGKPKTRTISKQSDLPESDVKETYEIVNDVKVTNVKRV